LPRNDIFFRPAPDKLHKQKSYVIYTPTFRSNGRRDVFGFDTDRVVGALEQRFGGEWYVMISSHPNMRSYYHELYDFSHPRMIDVGREDLHPLLRMSEALITDYSSAEMDFSLMNRPVFQLCKDRADYDRGFYIQPEELPFPYAETDDQLVNNILSFDAEKYAVDLETFNRERIGLHETGHASEDMIRWMLDRR
jgi:CDP-glycerol glycerophosphotransferase